MYFDTNIVKTINKYNIYRIKPTVRPSNFLPVRGMTGETSSSSAADLRTSLTFSLPYFLCDVLGEFLGEDTGVVIFVKSLASERRAVLQGKTKNNSKDIYI